VVASGNWPGSPTAADQPQANRLLVRSEFPMWALRTFAQPVMVRLGGVPKGFPLTAVDARAVTDIIDTTFPVVPRADDPLASYNSAQSAAARIPGARLVGVDRGGHLMLGQQKAVGPELAAFLERPPLTEARAAPASGIGSL
jgi:hypothetical protein